MTQIDLRGCRASGATPAAAHLYEQALAAFQSWHRNPEQPLAMARQLAPDFVMAHVLQAYLLLGSRDARRVRDAQPALDQARALPANARERLHLAAIAAVLADDYEGAKARLTEVLREHPRDVLALQMAHSLDHVTGETTRMRERIAAVLPAWRRDLPGYHAVLAMHAFSLVECGDYEHAEQSARAALALRPDDARAHHAMAHVFEMTDRPDAGIRWLTGHVDQWGRDSVVITHGWWHVALFQLALGRPDRALELYDGRIRAHRSEELADLIDAAALLWRIQLSGRDAGTRWRELADAWASHIDDGYCSFSDMHAMLAFVGARDWELAQRLEQALVHAQARPTRHGATTRQLGLPACRALIAFGRANGALAVTLLASLPERAHSLGGSRAQRDVLHLTLLAAVERLRRPARRHALSLPAGQAGAALDLGVDASIRRSLPNTQPDRPRYPGAS